MINGILVHVIQYNLVSCVLIEVFSSILIMKQKLSCEWKEQQLNQLNEQISRNIFFLSQWRGHLNTNHSTWPGIWPAILSRGQGISPAAISKVQMPEGGPETAEQLWDLGGTLVSQYLGGEGRTRHFHTNVLPPVPLLGTPCGPRGEDVEASNWLKHKSSQYQGPCGLGKHNECLKYVCYHIILAKVKIPTRCSQVLMCIIFLSW